MTKSLYILGAGGHGKVVADAAIKMNKWREIYFLDDQLQGDSILGVKVIDVIDNALKYKNFEAEFVVAIGKNDVREKIQNKLKSHKCNLATIIHPFTSIGSEVFIGEGTVIFAGVVVNSSVQIGNGCILNTSCTLDHDSIIGNYAHISPGVHIAGESIIGNNTWLGISSAVINSIKITSGCIVGAGAIVTKNIVEEGVYIGVPASKKI